MNGGVQETIIPVIAIVVELRAFQGNLISFMPPSFGSLCHSGLGLGQSGRSTGGKFQAFWSVPLSTISVPTGKSGNTHTTGPGTWPRVQGGAGCLNTVFLCGCL